MLLAAEALHKLLYHLATYKNLCNRASNEKITPMSFLISHVQKLPHDVIVTNISLILLALLDTLQLATGATGLWSQWATAVIHGCSIHAQGPILGETTLLVDWAPSATLWN